jgi:heme-degrading monooxygenase HmoA
VNRRLCLETLLGAGVTAAARAAGGPTPIQLHVDLSVDPKREQEMLHNFQTIFLPAARKQPGYIDVKMLKLRAALQGKPVAGSNYRFVLTFASEELRQKWVASATHKKVWPTIENTLTSKDYTVLLYDVC